MKYRIALLLGLAACRPPPELLRSPDPDRDGLAGDDGPMGAALTTFRMAAAVSESRRVRVVYPADQDGQPDDRGAPYPAAVLLHGGFVAPERYEWLAAHLATRGIVTILPSHSFQLALFESGNGGLALSAVRGRRGLLKDLIDDDSGAVVLGHSLGGVAAGHEWVEDETFDGLALLAAIPNPADPVEDVEDRPVLALTGSADERIVPGDVADVASDGAPTVPQDETRLIAQAAIDGFIDATLAGEPFVFSTPGLEQR
jgi:hypothetical protein